MRQKIITQHLPTYVDLYVQCIYFPAVCFSKTVSRFQIVIRHFSKLAVSGLIRRVRQIWQNQPYLS